MKLLLLAFSCIIPLSLAGPFAEEVGNIEALIGNIEALLQDVKDISEDEFSNIAKPDLIPTDTEEVLLYTENADKATAEIEAVGGRVGIELGQNLLIANVPTHIATKQDAFAHASAQIPSTASAAARHGPKIYEMYRQKKLAPQPKIQIWTEKTAPKAFPRSEPVPENSLYSPTMTGKIAGILLVVSGPGSLAISNKECDKAVSEAIAGLQFWVNQAASNGVTLSFRLYYGVAKITDSNPTRCSSYSTCHNVFANSALQYFGYSDKDKLAQDYKNKAGANGAYISFISKYRQKHFAYAYFGGGPLYMQYSNDGWGTNQIDRVYAHEVGHIFNAPDEYTSCNCNTDYGKGSCTAKNGNCKHSSSRCTSSQKTCIMNSNSFEICSHSKKHVGWC